MYAILVALLLLAFTVLAWRDFKLALTLILALLPTYLLRFEVVIPWTVLEGLILIAFAIWMFKFNPKWILIKTWFGSYFAPLLALLLVATLALIWSPDLTSALGIWKAYYLEPLLVFLMLRSTFTEPTDWRRALTTLALSVITVSVFAIVQKLTGLGIPVPWDLERRVTSVFEYPNALGLFVAPIMAALIVNAWHVVAGFASGVKPATTVLVIGIGLAAIILAQTEAAFVAIPAAIFITLLMSRVTTKTKIAALLGTAGIALVVIVAVPAVRSKLLLQDYSGGVRRSQWSETVQLLKDRPFLGAGVSGYPTALEPYHDPRLYEIFQYPHNVLLNVWVELGILGVIVSLWLVFVVLRQVWRNRHEPLVLAAAAALFTMAIHGLVDVPFMKNDLAVLTVFFLAMSLQGIEHQARVNVSQFP